MSSLIASKEVYAKVGQIIRYPVAAGAHIYKGALVCADADGYAVPAADTAGYAFLGVAAEESDNTGGADDDASVRVLKTGTVEVARAAASRTDIGQPFYIADDQTVTDAATASQDILAGYAVEAPDNATLRLRIDRAVQ
ncbi:MAG: DUF2190 family protein [Armatimonadetes bacterium]|nr:DUF2190 family protein [Armatimonadota bacterium]